MFAACCESNTHLELCLSTISFIGIRLLFGMCNYVCISSLDTHFVICYIYSIYAIFSSYAASKYTTMKLWSGCVTLQLSSNAIVMCSFATMHLCSYVMVAMPRWTQAKCAKGPALELFMRLTKRRFIFARWELVGVRIIELGVKGWHRIVQKMEPYGTQ